MAPAVGTVWSKQADNFALIDLEADTADDLAATITFCDSVGLQCAHYGVGLCFLRGRERDGAMGPPLLSGTFSSVCTGTATVPSLST